MAKKKDKKDKAEINKQLEGFDIKVNEFGELISNIKVDKINDFLNENVNDKKLTNDKKEEKNEE